VARHRASFGSVRRLPSGAWQARYTGPDLIRHKAPSTFQTKGDAEAWLALRRSEVLQGKWRPEPGAWHTVTFDDYAEKWLENRPLKRRTRDHYRSLLDSRILPAFGTVAVTGITSTAVRDWYARMGSNTPTTRAHAYGLLRAILATAVTDDLIPANPCHIRGAGSTTRAHKIKPASLAELATLVDAMPARFQAMTLIAAWCGLRFGELTELRRRDVDLSAGVLRIRRGVVRAAGEVIVGTPKTAAGIRDVAVPPHLLPAVEKHLIEHAAPGRDGLLFPATTGGHLAPSTLYRSFYAARAEAGRGDLRWHDLRHTGAGLAASTGATLAELMGRLGHSTAGAALRYQHAAAGRDHAIARALSALAEADAPGPLAP